MRIIIIHCYLNNNIINQIYIFIVNEITIKKGN
jgi:hypothetical protein